MAKLSEGYQHWLDAAKLEPAIQIDRTACPVCGDPQGDRETPSGERPDGKARDCPRLLCHRTAILTATTSFLREVAWYVRRGNGHGAGRAARITYRLGRQLLHSTDEEEAP